MLKFENIKTNINKWAFGFILFAYILVWSRDVQILISITPRSDFKIYENALTKTLSDSDPYDIRELGPAFIYPPPSLFVIEFFSILENPVVRKLVFLIVNILILILIIQSISRYFGYSIKKTWFWFPLGFFFAPYFAALQVGQINLVTEFGILIFFISPLPIFAALGIALATITKVTPVAFLFYSMVRKETKVILYSAIVLVAIFLASIFHYGLTVHLTYIDVFKQLLQNFPIAQSSQSLVSKVWMISSPPFHPSLFQKALMLYLSIVVISSALFSIKTRDTIPLFIVISLSIIISPNVMWYHHYAFLLLPFYIWMAWQKLEPRLVLWIMLGMLIIQIDYYFFTTGFIIHTFVQISILRILYQQYSQLNQTIAIHDLNPV